ncbi:MAG: hypothetical protein GXO39_04140 [Thermotogae bacterium]|nr:hypothetical protein [Thermotogota bacterium]
MKIRWLPVAFIILFGCRYRGLPEGFFVYPIGEGVVWYYEEDVPPDYPDSLPIPLDSIVTLKETLITAPDGEKVKAWKVRKQHESSYAGLIVDTNTVFFHTSALKEWLPTAGLFPDSVPYGSQTIYFEYDEDSVLVTWIPLYVRPGIEWIMTSSKGRIIIGNDTCSLTLDIWGKAQGYEDITYLAQTDRFKGEKRYEKSIRVDYFIKGGVCNLGVEITLLRIWWKSGVGPVKNVAITSSDSLVTYLVGFKP